MSYSPPRMKKVTTADIRARKGAERLVVITAYDHAIAKLVDGAVDAVLVGDSVGMVMQGHRNTLAVTVDHMVYHSAAVARALKHAHLVVDMPFMSYQTGWRSAMRNAGRILAEGAAESVKLEGGVGVAPIIEKLVAAGIPVMGHIGLTPQSVHVFGGYKIQGKSESTREAILADALAVEAAGGYALVLEGIPAALAEAITARVKIPTIGIGAGPRCDGQVLVSTDLLGLDPDFQPRFVKRYANLADTVRSAVERYAGEVRGGTFPDASHSF